MDAATVAPARTCIAPLQLHTLHKLQFCYFALCTYHTVGRLILRCPAPEQNVRDN